MYRRCQLMRMYSIGARRMKCAYVQLLKWHCQGKAEVLNRNIFNRQSVHNKFHMKGLGTIADLRGEIYKRYYCECPLYVEQNGSLMNTVSLLVCLFWRDSPQWARASSFTKFLDHTQRRTTVGRTPLNEWSARRRDFYLTTHTILTTDKRSCPRWDSNPQSQQANGRRLIGTAATRKRFGQDDWCAVPAVKMAMGMQVTRSSAVQK